MKDHGIAFSPAMVSAILRRLKKRGAIIWKWDFPGGDSGVILEGGGFAATEGGER